MEISQCRIGQHVLVHELFKDTFVARICNIEQSLVRVSCRNRPYAVPIQFITPALRPLVTLTYAEAIKLFCIAFDAKQVEGFKLVKINADNLELRGKECVDDYLIGKVLDISIEYCFAYFDDDKDENAVCPFNARAVIMYLESLEIDIGGLIDKNLAVDIRRYNNMASSMADKTPNNPNESSPKPDKAPTNPLVLALAALVANRRKAKEQEQQSKDPLQTLLDARKKLQEITDRKKNNPDSQGYEE